MHELSICQALITELSKLASEHQAHAITAFTVVVGPLAGVEPHLLAQAFPLAAAGTPAEHATLTVQPQPITITCPTCGYSGPATPNNLTCPTCRNWRTTLTSGDQLLLTGVRLEVR